MLGMAAEAEVVAALLAEPALAAARRATVVANPSAVVRALRVVGDGAAVRRGALRRACRDTRHAPSCSRQHDHTHRSTQDSRAREQRAAHATTTVLVPRHTCRAHCAHVCMPLSLCAGKSLAAQPVDHRHESRPADIVLTVSGPRVAPVCTSATVAS